jgi:hypothetical protein
VHLPLEGAKRLARAFAAAEPGNVLMCIRGQEEELMLGGNVPGDRYLHDLIRQYQPGWALARQWAGFEREVEDSREGDRPATQPGLAGARRAGGRRRRAQRPPAAAGA